MNDDELQFKKRLIELSERSEARGVYEATDFLSLAQQSLLHSLEKSGEVSPALLFGGTSNAERMIAVFGNETDCGYAYVPEISFLFVEPKNERFGEALSHRDILGALMSLGIKRELTGDIFTRDKRAYIVALSSIALYISENLISVKHTDVKTSVIESLPEDVGVNLREECFISTSERLDCVLAAVYNISRNVAKGLFEKERVFVNGSLRRSASSAVKQGDVVSVRGMGKFIFLGETGATKKGRLKIAVGIYE